MTIEQPSEDDLSQASPDNINKMRKFVNNFAEKSGSFLHPQSEITEFLVIGLAKNIDEVEDNEMILDIGPKTISSIEVIINKSRTVLWNGPAGYFENPDFANGSYEIAKSIVKNFKSNSIYSVAGGGDTIAVINKINAINDFNFVSTAGGAFLEYLEGKILPGISALS